MEKFGVKATFYDLFGYVIPGALLIGLIAHVYVSAIDPLCQTNVCRIISEMNAYAFLGLLGSSYVIGHFLAALSSAIIEKRLCVKVKTLANKSTLESVLPSLHHKVKKEYKAQFGEIYDVKDSFRILSATVEEYMPRAYSTAFIFLSLYGMARNFALVFFIAFVTEAILAATGYGSYLATFLLLIPAVVFFFQYIKFRQHFLAQICSAYLLHRNEKSNEKE